MQKIMLTLFVASLLGGCSVFGVYKVDIPQGTPLTQAQASKVQVGMNYQQVRFLLGSPTVTDPLNPSRWDYIYNYIPGTYAKKAKIPAAHGQHLKIYFNESGIVTNIEGLETIPESQPGLPASKEAILNAPPL
ncbi:outer membrane protein assembly factor BamE [Acinetobacter sichuanensis]|uniref:Outer membrane protein assembly factor BamE n=1 Tax=Acinetobacter sichuanensis TaxID=2136183 RepID=A0A371YQ82_9GAMM|nr:MULTISPECIES: outer membrane protein assembly factor BamE [Acinetobacter]MDM1249353.1 outer membrane protein assembly factor BamE [Acinetobacter sp. R933-2]MDM1762686.1 outer membrane protein assembly factor BamE [Acinetobacter sp. 226-1]MDM1766165.1 outer membrane protein assembly factor BamE [Acinetobacter sp. 226-4]MDQ9020899.1 outer membrane protein assembly factor BamE [Acinetobacter sichuanensis]RFC83602.1 outer membrane protein assembly factor BamE [Acinetobacter sichuanensis]